MDAVVEITQRRHGFLDKALHECPFKLTKDKEPDFWYRGGCTLIIDIESGRLRYCVYKKMDSEHRYERQRDFMAGRYAAPSLAATYFDASSVGEQGEVFSFVHRSHEGGE